MFDAMPASTFAALTVGLSDGSRFRAAIADDDRTVNDPAVQTAVVWGALGG